jgi:hypothetical protein
MVLTCPQCGLINSPSAPVCDCGHRFVAQDSGRSAPDTPVGNIPSIITAEQYKFCPHCGTEFISTAQYCFNCGAARMEGIEGSSSSRAAAGFALSVSGHLSFQRNTSPINGPLCERCKQPIQDLHSACELTLPGKPPVLLCSDCGELLLNSSAGPAFRTMFLVRGSCV